MKYLSTRGHADRKQFCDILLEGLAPDGGLYLPEYYPQVDDAMLTRLRKAYHEQGYAELAFQILSLYIDDIPAADLVEIPTFVMLRRLMLTAWIGTHPESGPAQTLGHRFASGTAQLAQSYLTDPSWFRVSALTAH